MYQYSHNILKIDLGALRKNYAFLRNIHNTPCAAVLKADAYGLGAQSIAQFLYQEGCQHFFVATLDEAISLRSVFGSKQAFIAVLLGILSPLEAEACFQYKLIPVLNHTFQLQLWESLARRKGRQLPAILHIDTGINRLGFPFQMLDELSKHDFKDLKIHYVMSHYIESDMPTTDNHHKQLIKIQQLKKAFPHISLSINNSGAILHNAPDNDLSRAGRILFGISPIETHQEELTPIMTLYATILQLHHIDTRTTVGYGATYEAMPGSRLATISIGYADGYLRHLSNRGYAAIGGYKAPIAGRISMDVTTLNVTEIPEELLYPGAKVEIIGPHCPVNDVASHGDTLGIELLTRVGNRIKRIYED